MLLSEMTIEQKRDFIRKSTLSELREMQRFGYARVDHPIFRDQLLCDFFFVVLCDKEREIGIIKHGSFSTQVQGRKSDFAGDGKK